MKYPAYNHKLTLRGNLIELLGVNNTFSESQIFDRAAKQILKRDEVQGTINGLKQLLELPESAGLTELFNAVEALELNKSERNALMSMRNDLETLIKGNEYWKGNTFDSVTRLIEIATAPDTTQPQLSEIRYVLHGDIQPCSVLYSDDTTTLLRLDEGDMMLETDTIEWSDSVTYRCQELLKSVDVRSLGHVAPRLAQLVRDERILLNDNGDDELPRPAVVIPRPSMVKPIPSCNNPYVHTNTAYLEEPMRAVGWTTEELVQNGYGHYVPVQHPADTEREVASRKWADKQREHLSSQPKQER